MNQIKTGCFIAEMRKEKNMTQKELADLIGVSDKTISKWENGKSLPDMIFLPELCKVLGVTANEIFSGEKLSDSDYAQKAEETIMTLMKENETNKNSKTATIVGALALILGVVFLMASTVGFGDMVSASANFIDVPSILFLLLFCFGAVLVSKRRSKDEILTLIDKIILPTGMMVLLFSAVIIFIRLDDLSVIGPNLAVSILSLFYASIVKIVVTIMLHRK